MLCSMSHPQTSQSSMNQVITAPLGTAWVGSALKIIFQA